MFSRSNNIRKIPVRHVHEVLLSAVHKDVLMTIDTEKVAKKFVEAENNRISLFGRINA